MPKTADLLEEIAALKALLIAADARDKRKDERIARLEKLVAAFRQAVFGRKSEKSDPDQFELALEDLETAMAVIHAEEDAEDRAAKRPAKPRVANRGALPKHLPRIEEIIEPDSLICACGGCLHCIGEDVSERLDIVPAQFRVIVTRRPKYACRSCTDGVAQAAAPARLSRDAEDRPVYGGTPADFAVVQAIREMKARGLRVTFYPFLLMDVPPGNTLPNPYSNNAATPGQPSFPWRGRITCSPAAGYALQCGGRDEAARRALWQGAAALRAPCRHRQQAGHRAESKLGQSHGTASRQDAEGVSRGCRPALNGRSGRAQRLPYRPFMFAAGAGRLAGAAPRGVHADHRAARFVAAGGGVKWTSCVPIRRSARYSGPDVRDRGRALINDVQPRPARA